MLGLKILPTTATPTLTESICSIFCNLAFCRLYCVEVVASASNRNARGTDLKRRMQDSSAWEVRRFAGCSRKKKWAPFVVDCIIRGNIGLYDLRVETQSWNDSEASYCLRQRSFLFYYILWYVSNLCCSLHTVIINCHWLQRAAM